MEITIKSRFDKGDEVRFRFGCEMSSGKVFNVSYDGEKFIYYVNTALGKIKVNERDYLLQKNS